MQLIVGAATIGVAFRVGTRNTRVNQQIGTRDAHEAASATLQREVAAWREEFWKRFTYALTGSPNPADARIEFRLLRALISSDLATVAEPARVITDREIGPAELQTAINARRGTATPHLIQDLAHLKLKHADDAARCRSLS